MSLNIKNPEAYRLAHAIADATGETLTHAVTEALRERYAKIEKRKTKASVEELLAIADRVSGQIKGSYQPHGDFLYDANGLPK